MMTKLYDRKKNQAAKRLKKSRERRAAPPASGVNIQRPTGATVTAPR
jgi:hypothetical protein